MPEITIEESTFQRLQRHAKPLVDTTDSVINRALDALERQVNNDGENQGDDVTNHPIDPQFLPDLTHTTILSASLSGQSVMSPNWSKLFDCLLVRAMKQVDDFSKLRNRCSINMVQGRITGAGYRYLPEINISVQGMSANATCKAIVEVAQSLDIGLDITYMWRCKEGALHPGDKGNLSL